MKFVDHAIIEVISGAGGAGAISFRREKWVPRGGPDGGHGGRGGSVIFEASPHHATLMDFRYQKRIEAPRGQAGGSNECDGRDAEDLIIPVPVGTSVFDVETGVLLVDLTEPFQKHVIAKGGRGGKGNMFFKTSTHQAPRFSQDGEAGESRTLRLELRLLADVGLVGLPNAGKSTFLSRISAAKPKVADYPFTTLTPQLGVVEIDHEDPFVVADLPGLIEGAHLGKGMGDQFLKHAERTRVLLHLVSLSPLEELDPVKRYETIKKEVQQYFEINADEVGKHQRETLIVLTQSDLISKEEAQKMKKKFEKKTNFPVFSISSATGVGVQDLLRVVKETIKNLKTKESQTQSVHSDSSHE